MSEDNSWVFDSLVCFLHGPIWNAPLQTFIEDKSLIFDPNEKVDDTNPEVKKIHNEYKNLVDYMLGSFMEEMQITPEQFEVACFEGRNSEIGSVNAFSFHQALFQQIWAANDMHIFVRMMTQRNLEIQLQALDLIERNQNTGKEIDYPDILKHNDNMVKIETEGTSLKKQVEPLEVLDENLDTLPSEEEVDDKFKRLNLFFDKEKIDSADIKARQEYLKAQRDKILEIKKNARSRQLNETAKKTGRPSSAQVAHNLMEGNTDSCEQPPPEASLQLRKTLAKRLRSEVVSNNE